MNVFSCECVLCEKGMEMNVGEGQRAASFCVFFVLCKRH